MYLRNPISFTRIGERSVPVFSEQDSYIENYQKISADHLAIHDVRGINPFMDESFWQECEDNTAEMVRKYTPAGGKLLDVGCGMGRLLNRLPDFDRYGMDISEGYLAHALDKGIQCCLSKVEDMPYLDAYFDAVVCTDVLEHVIDLNAAVHQLYRVTKPGGTIIVRVPYCENLAPYLDSSYPYELAHVRNFDEYSLRMLFERIFAGKVLEAKFGPYSEERQCFKIQSLNVKGFGFLSRKFLGVLGFFSPRFRKWVTKKLFEPAEISMAVRIGK